MVQLAAPIEMDKEEVEPIISDLDWDSDVSGEDDGDDPDFLID